MRDGDIDWSAVKRVLVVRLRSIGDTVLTTPSLIALRRALPDAQIDILLEPWVAPLLDGFEAVDNVHTLPNGLVGRLRTSWELRRQTIRRRYKPAWRNYRDNADGRHPCPLPHWVCCLPIRVSSYLPDTRRPSIIGTAQ